MYEVKDSPIHGLGLFASIRIPKGALIGTLEGVPTKRDGPHVLWVTEEVGIAGVNDIRYVNHARRANACYFDDGTLVALRDIDVGEEITHDYGQEWD